MRRRGFLAALGSALVANPMAAAAQQPTGTQINDPVEQSLVASLAQPGGDMTGFTQMSAELHSKRLQLVHEIVPSVSRAALNPNLTRNLDERFAKAEAAAKSLGIAL